MFATTRNSSGSKARLIQSREPTRAAVRLLKHGSWFLVAPLSACGEGKPKEGADQPQGVFGVTVFLRVRPDLRSLFRV